jgi:hypothetical protein
VTQQKIPDTVASGEAPAGAPGRSAAAPGRRRADALMAGLCLAVAGAVTAGLWLGPNHRALSINASDQALFEWLLSYAANALRRGDNPLWTTLLNAPGGVNLAVNTAATVLGWALAPVTWLLGPSVSFTLALTFAIAATPMAWYLLLSRHVVHTPAAAIVGGLFCGFAPGLISHANGHLNFASGYLVPLIVWRVLELRRPGHALRNGLILGALIAVQYSLGGETLFFTALAYGVFLVGWLLAGHREPRQRVVTFARGLGTAGVTAFALLSYPLYMQFLGPGSFHGTGFNAVIHSEDLLAYGAFPRRSLAGVLGFDSLLAVNPTEENSFFGLPTLLVVIAAAALALRHSDLPRRRLVRAVLASTVVFTVLSLGPQLKVNHHNTRFPLPYALLQHAPLFDSALPGRLALVVIPLAGVLLALGLDTLPKLRRPRLVAAVVAVALLPIVPVPLRTMERSPVPHFISSGRWRDYVQPGETLIPIPPASDWLPDGQRWQTAMLASGDGTTFRIPAGFFLGPGGPDGRGRIGPVPQPTFSMLHEAALGGPVPAVITPAMREQARADARYWGGNVIVMPANAGRGNRWATNQARLLDVATDLYGQPTRVDDVWLWRV